MSHAPGNLRCLKTNKVIYAHRKAAMGAASNMRRHTGDDNIVGFKCDGCHSWHIGHTTPGRRAS